MSRIMSPIYESLSCHGLSGVNTPIRPGMGCVAGTGSVTEPGSSTRIGSVIADCSSCDERSVFKDETFQIHIHLRIHLSGHAPARVLPQAVMVGPLTNVWNFSNNPGRILAASDGNPQQKSRAATRRGFF